MPSPQASALRHYARNQFSSFGLIVPMNWTPPIGNAARHFAQAFSEADLAVAPDPSPPALFRAATRNRLHVETQRHLSHTLGEYIDGICAAVCSAWSRWQAAASITGIVVDGSVASGGVVVGPPWLPWIMPDAPQRTPIMLRYSTAIATAISEGWLQYQATVKIPALRLYPAFHAFPGPVAPPKLGVPVPLAKLTQDKTPISKAVLEAQMMSLFGDRMAPFARELFASMASGFEQAFMTWQGSTTVTNVIGKGLVPSYNPPQVTAGPVVRGTAHMAPGGLV